MEPGTIAAAVPLVLSTGHTAMVVLEIVAALVTLGALCALYRRRRSPQYLLVLLAASTIALRGAAGAAEMFRFASVAQVDAVEHGLDVAMVLLLLAAVYAVGNAEKRVSGGGGA